MERNTVEALRRPAAADVAAALSGPAAADVAATCAVVALPYPAAAAVAATFATYAMEALLEEAPLNRIVIPVDFLVSDWVSETHVHRAAVLSAAGRRRVP